MAHYDCSYCGEYGGISFGSCKSCTPEEYMKLNQELRKMRLQIEDDVDHLLEPTRMTLTEMVKATYADKLAEIEARMIELTPERLRRKDGRVY